MKELRKKLDSAATGRGGRGRGAGAAILERDGILNLFGESCDVSASELEEVFVGVVVGNLKPGSSSLGCSVEAEVNLGGGELGLWLSVSCDALSLSNCKSISRTEGLRLWEEVDLTGRGGSGPSMWPRDAAQGANSIVRV